MTIVTIEYEVDGVLEAHVVYCMDKEAADAKNCEVA